MQVRFDKQERLYRAVKMVRSIHLNAQRTMEAELAGSGISVAEHAVLELLCEEMMTVPNAARRLTIKRQFVQRVVAGLIEKGLVQKQVNPEHSSAYFCRPTERGQKLYDLVHENELALLHQALGNINQTEVVAALRVMARLDAAFQELAQRQP
ncbi:MarR family winged helix-turn-helix transcriptional regulator [Pararhizobium sp.]|uniref:MarR family winged helix-turn-helix transcriptional regulator n=1 Tax=Pararhizobium sp. TaxID=1977563 RepID=UPI00271C787E|nr:MarR family transcriptional regulator [Pararhizobium sp.]MDO9416583.1 MarR family transcriptional regulator [Pararhizobium sp.]